MRNWPLIRLGIAWALASLAGANLHMWAFYNREVAANLLHIYGMAAWTVITWRCAVWADKLIERHKPPQ